METATSKPWERRLTDLAQILKSCAASYFNPDLFRMNTNHFLQTARTVTFIIQKNKDKIPGYDTWYQTNVTVPWGDDELMRWAKDSRNTIEKEGDLELNSTLRLSLIFSYLEETDIGITCGKSELMTAGVKKLIRFAEKKMPTGVADAAAVKIERRWVTASLPEWELLHALGTVYGRIYACCRALASHLNSTLRRDIARPSDFEDIRDNARRVQYMKFSTRRVHSIEHRRVPFDRTAVPPQYVVDVLEATKHGPPTNSLSGAIQFFSRMAKATLEKFGNHVPILILFNKEWQLIDFVSPQFLDQADKFIFWRTIAESVRCLNIFGIVWISESWIRRGIPDAATPTRLMPITGERLSVIGLDKTGGREAAAWNIKRDIGGASVSLEPIMQADIEELGLQGFIFIPVLRAMGVPDPDYVRQKPETGQ